MGRKDTRRSFMKDVSTSAAALTALSASRAGAADGPGAGTAYLCVTCGTQFAESARPPATCPICEDERQYVNWKGQTWLTPEPGWGGIFTHSFYYDASLFVAITDQIQAGAGFQRVRQDFGDDVVAWNYRTEFAMHMFF